MQQEINRSDQMPPPDATGAVEGSLEALGGWPTAHGKEEVVWIDCTTCFRVV